MSPLRPFSRSRGTSASAKNDSSPPLIIWSRCRTRIVRPLGTVSTTHTRTSVPTTPVSVNIRRKLLIVPRPRSSIGYRNDFPVKVAREKRRPDKWRRPIIIRRRVPQTAPLPPSSGTTVQCSTNIYLFHRVFVVFDVANRLFNFVHLMIFLHRGNLIY